MGTHTDGTTPPPQADTATKSDAAIAQHPASAPGTSEHPATKEASAEYHFLQAQAYVAEGNPDRAIEEYKATLMYDPDSSLVYARLATEYIKKGMLSAAMETCNQALARNPDYRDARLLLAGLYSSAHQNAEAIKEYDHILKDHPTDEEAAIYKSQILAEDGKPADGVKSLKNFLKKNPESAVVWFYMGRMYQQDDQAKDSFKNAVAAFKKAMDVRPGFSQAGLALGYLYEEKLMNKEAIATYKAIFDDSQDPGAASRLATIYLKDEKYQEAVPYLEVVSASDPEDMNARVKLGLVQMELKNYDQAVTIFKNILAKNPDADRIHYYLGSVYEETKKLDQSIAELKQIKPDSKLYTDAALHVAYLLKVENKTSEAKAFVRDAITKAPRVSGFYIFDASLAEDIPEAVSILETAVAKFPEEEKLRYYLGSLYDKQGNQDKGLEQMEEILKINPQNVDALNYIAYTWTQKGIRLNDAEQMLKKALTLKPDNGYVQDSWGWYLYTRGRNSEAVVELEKAAKLKPNESTILEHLADAYLKSNLREKAFQKYVDAAKVADDTDSRQKLEGKANTLRQELVQAGRLPATVDKGESRSPAGGMTDSDSASH